MNRPEFLATGKGIKKVPEFKRLKSFFCRHDKLISGISCSSLGFKRISGTDNYTVCQNCGKIISEEHINY